MPTTLHEYSAPRLVYSSAWTAADFRSFRRHIFTRLAIDQGILQAAFQAFAKISSLRLSDFLR